MQNSRKKPRRNGDTNILIHENRAYRHVGNIFNPQANITGHMVTKRDGLGGIIFQYRRAITGKALENEALPYDAINDMSLRKDVAQGVGVYVPLNAKDQYRSIFNRQAELAKGEKANQDLAEQIKRSRRLKSTLNNSKKELSPREQQILLKNVAKQAKKLAKKLLQRL